MNFIVVWFLGIFDCLKVRPFLKVHRMSLFWHRMYSVEYKTRFREWDDYSLAANYVNFSNIIECPPFYFFAFSDNSDNPGRTVSGSGKFDCFYNNHCISNLKKAFVVRWVPSVKLTILRSKFTPYRLSPKITLQWEWIKQHKTLRIGDMNGCEWLIEIYLLFY